MRKTAVLLVALTAAPAAAETTVMASFDKLAGFPFRQSVRGAVAEAAKEAAVPITFEEIGGDPAKHLRNVEAAIAAKAAAVITTATDQDVARQIAALAKSSDTALVFVNVRHTLDHSAGRVSMVSSNDLVAGRVQMRVIADKLGGAGPVAVLRGPDADGAARERRAGMQEIFAEYPRLILAAEANADWSRSEAKRIVEGWLKEGRTIGAIAAANDDMALGAVAALREAGLAGKVPVGDVDGLQDAVTAIKAGDMICSVFQNGPGQGARAFANAMKLSRGEYVQQYDWVSYELIVAGNADAYVRR